MTKHLRYLFATLLVWVCTVGGYAETKSVVCTLGQNAASCTSTGDCSVTWTYESNPTTTTSPDNGMYWAIKANKEVVLTASLSAKSVTITSIKIQAYTNNGTGKTIEVYVGDTKIGKTATLTSKSAEYTFDGNATGDVLLHLKSSSSTKSHIVKTVTINYEESGSSTTKTATNLSFGTDKDGSIVALTEGLLADGSEFAGYTATEANSVAGTITYAATGDNVATMDAATGAVTINKTTYGTTTITATFTPADAETYAASTATYTITNEKKVDESTIVFSSDDKSFAKISDLSGSGYKSGNIDFVASNGKSYTFTCYRVLLGNDRLQINNSKVTSPKFDNFTSGYNLTVTYSSNNGNLKLSSGSSAVTGASTGGVTTYKSVTLNVSDGSSFVIEETKSNALYIKSIEIVKNAPKADPALSFANPTEEVELNKGLINVQSITKPADLDDKEITYVSSDNTIAEVTEDMIELKKTGEVTIKATSAATATYAAGSAEYTLKIVDTRADAPISVKEESVDAELNDEMYDSADNINNTNELKLTYASSNADITIDEDGYLTFSKVGSTTVTVSFAGDKTYKPFETSFTLNVVDSRADAPISIKEQTVTVQLPTDSYESSTNVTNDKKLALAYAIDNEDYLIDEKTGLTTFDKVGSATITVSFAGDKTYKPFTGTFTLNVEESRTTDESFKFDAESYTLDLAEITDEKVTFDANAKLQNNNNLTCTWTINPQTNGESIDASGMATGLKRDTYTITATSETNKKYLATTATCTLEVTNSAIEDYPVTFDANTDKGEKSGAAPDQMKKSFVSIVSGRAAFGNGRNYRFYQTYGDQTGETTISTKLGNITKIEFVGSDTSKSLKNLSTNDNKYSASSDLNGIWTGSAKSVTFTASATAYATKITVTLELPVAKDYTLDETTTGNVIETYENANVTLKRTLDKSYWNTFCVPFALDAEQVKEYFGEGTLLRTYEGNCEDYVVNFTVVDNIEAGKPYIMKPGNSVVTDPEFKNVSMVADDLDAEGNPQAVGSENSVQMKGIYNHVTLQQSETNLFLGDGDKFYYPADAEACEMDGLRAYFLVPEGTDLKKLRANLDGTVTSLGAIFGTEEIGAAVYNLQGVCVGNSLKQLKSGVYIQNGKKIVVK